MEKSFDRWEFIAKWLPDYSSNSQVAYSNDLACYIDGTTENSRYSELQILFPDVNDAIIEQEAVDSMLFQEAYEYYSRHMEKEMRRKRAELEGLTLFKISVAFEYKGVTIIAASDKDEAEKTACKVVRYQYESMFEDDGYALAGVRCEVTGSISD